MLLLGTCFCLLVSSVCGSKILAWFTCPAVSHQSAFQPIWKELSLRGHQVTVITPNPLNEIDLVNLTEIDIGFTYQVWKEIDISNMRRELSNAFSTLYYFHKVHERSIEMSMKIDAVQNILKKDPGYFDLILIESHSPILFGLKHKLKSTLIAISSLGFFNHLNFLIGNSVHPALYPDFVSELSTPMTLLEKIDSLHLTIGNYLINRFIISPHADDVARAYFGQDMPYIEDMVKETSLILENVNPVFSDRRPLVPNSLQYTHVTSNRNEFLGKDLKQILDNAKEGVVYFSLGTNVRFDHVQGDVKKNIMAALGDLPYTVICKWESESIEGQPKNVHLRKWLPQQAVLAHPNVKVFITQGGLQSSEEAIINAVPLVVIPFLGDQPLNAKILKSNGMAETISPKELNRELLRDTILTVARKENYRQRAKELRDIFLDQPQSGVDKVVWWCEYVIRHKGAKHLRSPAADISLYHYFMIDVIAVFILSFYLTFKIIQLVFAIIVGLFRRKPAEAEVSRKKKKKN